MPDLDYLQAMEQGNFPLALTLLDRELQNEPKNPVLMYNFAICCFQTRNFAKVKSILESLLLLSPGFIEIDRVYRLLVFALIEQKNWEEAENLTQKRLELRPNDFQLLSFLAHIYEYTHRLPLAIDLHRKILKMEPSYKNSLNSLGYLLALKPDRTSEETQEAVQALKTLLELSPNHPAYLDSFGYLLQQIGKEEAALRAFRKGLERNPSDPILLERLKSFG